MLWPCEYLVFLPFTLVRLCLSDSLNTQTHGRDGLSGFFLLTLKALVMLKSHNMKPKYQIWLQ